MKKITLLILFFYSLLNITVAQFNRDGETIYGNEWIDYNKSYLKIKVVEDGMYRVPKSAIESAGFPIATHSGRSLQLFFRGKEVPIFVSNSNILSNTDFIEFYGQRNDGELDKHLWEDQNGQGNPHYSLFSDTSTYFLTWDNDPLQFQVSANNLTSNLTPEPYFFDKITTFNTGRYVTYGYGSNNLLESQYRNGEGYSNALPWKTGKVDYTFDLQNLYNANGINAIFKSSAISIDASPFTYRTYFNDNQFYAFNSSGIRHLTNTNTINSLELIDGNNIFSTEVKTTSTGANARYGQYYLELKYPAVFDFKGVNIKKFQVRASAQSVFLQIQNFNHGGSAPILYDLSSGLKITTSLENNVIKVVLPPYTRERDLVLVAENYNFKVPTSLSYKQRFQNLLTEKGNFIIVTHPILREPYNGQDQVQRYADHRASTGFQPLIVDINELYDQFSWGIWSHNITLRNFSHFALNKWDIQPTHLFIVGKGHSTSLRETNYRSFPYQFIPPYGFPESDNLLVSSLELATPDVAIGRLPATEPSQIYIYLNKVIDYENAKSNLPSTLESLWAKEFIHLGGGNNQNEQTTIKNKLNNYASIASDVQIGANVNSFFKTSTDPIQTSQSQEITDRINDGAAVVTFFGHSSPNSFDFSIDDPSTYQNFRKYPLMISLGCYSGNIHDNRPGISENFIFAEDKGAIAFIASSTLATISGLDVFSSSLYENMSSTLYGATIGEIIQASIRDNEANQSVYTQMVLQQVTLNGDPGLKIFYQNSPDLILDPSSLTTFPINVSTINDNFEVSFDIYNLGKSVNQEITVAVEQTFPNGSVEIVATSVIDAPSFKSSVTIPIPIDDLNGTSENAFRIIVDYNNDIIEIQSPDAELNNELTFNKYIFSNDIIPIYPANYSIVNEPQFKLFASTSNFSDSPSGYVFEIDTSYVFNSNIKESQNISSRGGLVEIIPSILPIDGATYFWRVSVDPVLNGGFPLWNNASFTYLNGSSEGWTQRQFGQFTNDNYQNIVLDSTSRRMEYVDTYQDVSVQTTFATLNPSIDVKYSVNNQSLHSYRSLNCSSIRQGIYIAVFDPITGQPWTNTNQGNGRGEYNSKHCSRSAPNYLFMYDTRTSEERDYAEDFLQNVVPDGHYVMVYNINDYQPELWLNDAGDNLIDIFNEFGLTDLTNTASTGAMPYAGFFRKGDPSFPVSEKVGTAQSDIINATFLLPGSWTQGSVTSTIVGPASKWSSVSYEIDEIDNNDVAEIDIYGIDNNNQEVLLFDNVSRSFTDISAISTSTYPKLRIALDNRDEINRTMPQLSSWTVLYDGIPEIVVNAPTDVSFHNDTIQEGDQYKLLLGLRNISSVATDSILISQQLINSSNQLIDTTFLIAPILPNSSYTLSIDGSTINNVGFNQLSINVNPSFEQPEMTLVNNFYNRGFLVIKDLVNPLLDVTFDGSHIINGDVISNQPNIVISLKDENRFLSLSDTSLFRIVLRSLKDSLYVPLVFQGNDNITFYPSDMSTGDNKAWIEIKPDALPSGQYEFFVYAEDASGNASGEADFKVNFVVGETKSSITNFINYPNPFSTSTQFAYTLNGNTIPDDVKIKVMTISGKLVKTITSEELGPLKPGTHLTDYRWDGTDDYGDQLANGVYLYKVIVSNQGRLLDKSTSETDEFFTKEYGKMMLLR